MANDALSAAGKCLKDGRFRSAVSRAYYAMFSAVTGALIRVGQEPRQPEGTWAHQKLPNLVRDVLAKRLGRGSMKDVRRRLGAAYKMRILADYDCRGSIDSSVGGRSVADGVAVLRALQCLQ